MSIQEQFSIFDLISVGICIVKSDFSVIHWNKIMEEWTGMTREEMLGKDVTKRCPGLDRAICRSRLKSLFADGTPIIFSSQLHSEIFPVRFPNGDKRIHNTTVSAISLDKDDKFGALFTIEDVTGLSRTLNNLLESRNFLKDVFNSIQDGISVKDADLTVRFANHVVEQKYGGGQCITGQKCYECLFQLEKPCKGCPSQRCINSGEMESSIRRGPPTSGAKWVEVFAYPLKNRKTGEVTGVINYIRDITERKKTEEELHQAKEHA
ncbi:MAG: PAS domain S-box protein [Desulfobacteraceae bacterium]|nr:PAS domain S-box protein [Desulfobacteraceae bacterium]MBC2755710.1 PAS domain S-box protein [Desulfobacteraceae bacterium]